MLCVTDVFKRHNFCCCNFAHELESSEHLLFLFVSCSHQGHTWRTRQSKHPSRQKRLLCGFLSQVPAVSPTTLSPYCFWLPPWKAWLRQLWIWRVRGFWIYFFLERRVCCYCCSVYMKVYRKFHFPLPIKFFKYLNTIRLYITVVQEKIFLRRLNSNLWFSKWISFYLQWFGLCSLEIHYQIPPFLLLLFFAFKYASNSILRFTDINDILKSTGA